MSKKIVSYSLFIILCCSSMNVLSNPEKQITAAIPAYSPMEKRIPHATFFSIHTDLWCQRHSSPGLFSLWQPEKCPEHDRIDHDKDIIITYHNTKGDPIACIKGQSKKAEQEWATAASRLDPHSRIIASKAIISNATKEGRFFCLYDNQGKIIFFERTPVSPEIRGLLEKYIDLKNIRELEDTEKQEAQSWTGQLYSSTKLLYRKGWSFLQYVRTAAQQLVLQSGRQEPPL